ncbi:double-strand break repair helicase AddA [Methylocella sp.]|uniref:double-strand break repair helicase AddA n=1 Tax=Methylocella sp. TaxID=1978226 RepID=UPI003783F3AF
MTLNAPSLTASRQKDASDPDASAWVSANAGSGKTHVLTQRVLRLLLRGTPPSRLLCLTFTKAAAANMSARVFDRLAEWTRLDDAALRRAVLETGAPEPDRADLEEARRLFARAVETPGGLKIQTIHAFCERVLHLFPFEANAPSSFEVADEERQADLLAAARRDVLERAADDARLGAWVDVVARDCAEDEIERLLKEALALRGKLREDWPRDHERALRAALKLPAGRDETAVMREMIEDGIAPARWRDLAAFLATGLKSDVERAQGLLEAQRLRSAGDAQGCLDGYLRIFFTEKGEPRKKLLTGDLAKRKPDVLDALNDEQARLERLRDDLRAARALARSVALAGLADAVGERYRRLKAERALLDYDDLVGKTLALLARSRPSWVLYKLDAGIDHILVDEAQDTSEAQWTILKSLMSEFAVGRSAHSGKRTFFAVGDEKQSIFSFQGAAPHLFDETRRALEKKFRDGGEAFHHVRLTHSFRSAPGVLACVDGVFEPEGHRRGLVAPAEPWMGHEAVKARLPALVEIWPLVGSKTEEGREDWRLPLDAVGAREPAAIVAERVARRVAGMIAPGAPDRVHEGPDGASRPVRAGDVLILLRRRGSFFETVIRALKRFGAPVAGADRLTLGEHIVAQDLAAAGRAASLPQDDLSLACVLKSPLVGLDDDDLIALAPSRAGALYDALAASPEPKHAQAREKIDAWRRRSALRPFDFYAPLLAEEGGRRAFEARLGGEAADAIDEFLRLALDHEREAAPSLSCFLAQFDALDRSVKRDMDAGADMVRVMTVHAAKGLEAKVVFLPDACNGLSAQHDARIFALEPEAPGERAVLWSPRKADDCARAAQARARGRDLAEDEYRRLLYVALTRAEERLYVAGFHGERAPPALNWAAMVADTIGADRGRFSPAPAPWDEGEEVLRFVDPGRAGAPLASASAPAPDTPAPAWLTRRLDASTEAPPPIRPSNALASAETRRLALDAGARRSLRAGALAHVLLQYLPRFSRAEREAAGRAFLDARAGDLSGAARARLVDDALKVIEAPDLAPLFGESSRAEAAVAGTAALPDGREVAVVGRIDRLATTPDALIVADYKTGAPPPREALPPAYLAQMALYRAALAPLWPNLAPRFLLVWTQGPRVDELAVAELDAALAAL